MRIDISGVIIYIDDDCDEAKKIKAGYDYEFKNGKLIIKEK